MVEIEEENQTVSSLHVSAEVEMTPFVECAHSHGRSHFRLMKRVLAGLTSIVALAVMAFSSTILILLVRSEVLPALSAGNLNIQTNSRILNRVWEGNELYWLIAVHAAVALIMAIAFVLSARFALGRVAGRKSQSSRK